MFLLKNRYIEKDYWYKNKNLNISLCSHCRKYDYLEKDCWNKNQVNYHKKIIVKKRMKKLFL